MHMYTSYHPWVIMGPQLMTVKKSPRVEMNTRITASAVTEANEIMSPSVLN